TAPTRPLPSCGRGTASCRHLCGVVGVVEVVEVPRRQPALTGRDVAGTLRRAMPVPQGLVEAFDAVVDAAGDRCLSVVGELVDRRLRDARLPAHVGEGPALSGEVADTAGRADGRHPLLERENFGHGEGDELVVLTDPHRA